MEYENLNELVEALSPYINASALGRICEINEGQMRQYTSKVRSPSPQTIEKINEGLNKFSELLKELKIKNPDI